MPSAPAQGREPIPPNCATVPPVPMTLETFNAICTRGRPWANIDVGCGTGRLLLPLLCAGVGMEGSSAA